MKLEWWISLVIFLSCIIYGVYLVKNPTKLIQLDDGLILTQRQFDGTLCKNMFKRDLISAGENQIIHKSFAIANENAKHDSVKKALLEMYRKNCYKISDDPRNLTLLIPYVKDVVERIKQDPTYDLTADYCRMLREVHGIRNMERDFFTHPDGLYRKKWDTWLKEGFASDKSSPESDSSDP